MRGTRASCRRFTDEVVRRRRDFVRENDDEHRADRNDFALADEDLRDDAARRRGDLDRRLVRRDLDERVVFGDLLAHVHEPARDLALGQALTEIGQLELVRHLRDPLQVVVVEGDEAVGVELYVRLDRRQRVEER